MKLAIIADIHEDIISLKHAIRKIEKNNCDKIICLGDISGFSVPHYSHQKTRNAHECLEIIKQNCEIIIIGNHDLFAVKKLPENNQKFKYPSNWYELDYDEKLKKSNGLIWLYDNDELNPLYTKKDIEFLLTLPEFYILKTEKYNILLTHYLYPDITGSSKQFLEKLSDFKEHFEFMKTNNCQISICGHAHKKNIFVALKNKIIQPAFKKLKLPTELAIILSPPIVNSNGFLIFDTDNFKLERKRI
ncbi:MAG: metallophosphoesterase family protein [Bacteroidota bacterium]|nr:metallophosphoesterase family protein [Bacteroidota bacterium]